MATGEDLGRGPDWNDDGLPQVDVEIPDDLRDLDREVQAYRRELRQRRREQLLRRIVPGYRRLGPYGVLAPIVAGTLLVTAVFGTMMSLLGPKSANPAKVTSVPPNSTAGDETGNVGEPLPDSTVTVDGTAKRLAGVRSAVVVAVPARCGCSASIADLTSAARATGVAVYLSGRHDQTSSLAERGGSYPQVLGEAQRILERRYHPVGLSAVLVDRHGRVTDIVRELDERGPLSERRLQRLGPTPGV